MHRGSSAAAVIPARNESQAIAHVIAGLKALRIADRPVIDPILVCDNGSSDDTAARATQAGALVVSEPRPGYGGACLAALAHIGRADVVLFIDGDHAFFPAQAIALLDAIADGADLAIGSRVLGRVERGAMTWPQIVSNAIVTRLIRWLWRVPITDLGPYRAIRYAALQRLMMRDRAYGWTVEMQVKAFQQKLRVVEVPVDVRVRIGHSKVSGTLRGVFGAGHGMLRMLWRLWLAERLSRGIRRESELVKKSSRAKGGRVPPEHRTVSPGAKRSASPAGVSLRDETNNRSV